MEPPLPLPAPSSVPHKPRRSGRQRAAPTRLGYDGNEGAWYYIEPCA
jgi:hypothetical protein